MFQVGWFLFLNLWLILGALNSIVLVSGVRCAREYPYPPGLTRRERALTFLRDGGAVAWYALRVGCGRQFVMLLLGLLLGSWCRPADRTDPVASDRPARDAGPTPLPSMPCHGPPDPFPCLC